jgi:hypothetical protein
MGDIVNAVSDVFGFGPASKQAKATTEAANISAQGNREALALQQRMYDEGVARQQPWLQAGTGAINELAAGLAPGGKYSTPFSQTNWQQDPGYAFRLSEGQKALDRSAAARGGLISGGALKAAARYGQDMGSQEYQNAFNRYYGERNQMLNPLQSLAGVGQTSANTIGASGANYAGAANQLAMTNAANQGNLALQRGNIAATQYGNYGNALNTALNTDWSKVGQKFGFGGSSGADPAGYGSGADASLFW